MAYFNQSLNLDFNQLGRKQRQDYLKIFPNFQNRACCEKYLKRVMNTVVCIGTGYCENVLRYFSLDIICSSKLTVFLELPSRKTVRSFEQIMSAGKCPNIFSCQIQATDFKQMFGTIGDDRSKTLRMKMYPCKVTFKALN